MKRCRARFDAIYSFAVDLTVRGGYMGNAFRWGAAGTLIGVLVWGCIHLVRTSGLMRSAASESAFTIQPFPPVYGAGQHASGFSYEFQRLSDPLAQSVARIATADFAAGKFNEGMKVVELDDLPADRDDILLAIVENLFEGVRVFAEPVPSGAPPKDAATISAQQKENEKAEMERYGILERIAEAINNPVTRATALSEIANHAVHPGFERTSTEPIASAERREFAERLRHATQAAIRNKMKLRRNGAGIDGPVFWIGTILFGLVGFLVMTFAKPIIETFGSAVGEALAKDVDPVKMYEKLRDAARQSRAGSEPVSRGDPTADSAHSYPNP